MKAKYFLFLAVLVLASVWIGCGGSDTTTTTEDNSNAGPTPTVINPNGQTVDPTTVGQITGTVKLDGTPPPPKGISMNAVPSCLQQRTDKATTEDVVPGDNGTLQNVVVYLQGNFSSYTFHIPQTPVGLEQKGCQYVPHVLAMMTDQPLIVTSVDMTSHNVHAIPKNNPMWNKSQPIGSAPIHETFAHPEVAIPVKCNIHAWMKAYVAVLDNPYFAVTGKDGSFTIQNVPPGTYTLTAWQETYGPMQQSVTVAPNQSQSVTFTFKAASGS